MCETLQSVLPDSTFSPLPSPSIAIAYIFFAMSDEPKEGEMSPQDLFWSTYLKDAEEEDKYLPKSWEANTGSVLTFVRAPSSVG